jgi:RNA polymerase sigma-70 factor (ECF subfamily)
MSDAQLAVLSQSGDRQAFTVLARRWERRLYHFLHRLLGDPEEAQDTCQEALLRAFVSLHTLREPEHFATWLHRIALNIGRDRNRSQKRHDLRLVGLDDEPVTQFAADEVSPHERAERAQMAAQVRRVLGLLPEEQRTAILLHELEGFTSHEISSITGVPAATVRSRIFYGLKALRRMLLEHGLAPASTEGGTGK